ncbi:MAG TPA: insulinase family protein [Haliangium sp.]|nr:insulinase family protein [Haliangium sp.]
MRGIAVLTLMALAGGCGAKAAGQGFQSPDLERGDHSVEYRLDVELYRAQNGLTVLLLPQPSTNLVRVDVRYFVGAAEDPAGKAGLAHLVEHMSFELLPKGPGGPSLENLLGLVALQHNAYTTEDETHYYAEGLAPKLESLIAIEAVRMRASCEWIDEKRFAREIEVVHNELRQRNGPGARIGTRLREEIYGKGHASRHLDPSELAGITRQDVCSFFERYYNPASAVLVVSGRIDKTEVARLVGGYFGGIEPRPPAARAQVTPPALKGTRSRLEADVDEATAFIAMPGAPFGDERVYQEFLTRTLLWRLSDRYRDNENITDVAFGQLGGKRAPTFVIAVSVKNPALLESVVDDVFDAGDVLISELDEPSTRSPRTGTNIARSDEGRLSTLRNQYSAALLRATEPFGLRAVRFADYLQYSDHTEFIFRDFKVLKAANRDVLRRYAERLLRKDRSHVMYVYPGGGGGEELAGGMLATGGAIDDLEPWHQAVNPADAEKKLPPPGTDLGGAIRELTLENGMRVLLVPSLTYPVVDIRLLLPGGRVDEPPDKAGVGALAASLLTWSFTRELSTEEKLDFFKVVQMGGNVERDQQELSTRFRVTGLSSFTAGLLWQVHWLITSGVYEYKALETERKRQAGRNTPSVLRVQRLLRARNGALFGDDHPYAAELYDPRRVADLELEDLEEFQKRHYRAAGATLIVTGHFDVADVEARIRRLFGALPAGGARGARDVPPSRPAAAPTYLAMDDPARAQTGISISFATASGFEAQHAARLVLAEMLREVLQFALRERMAASYGVEVTHSLRPGPGYLTIETDVDQARAGEAFSALRDELARLRGGDFAAAFVRARRAVLQRLMAAALDSGNVADNLELLAIHGLPRDYHDRLAQRVAALRIGDVRALMTDEMVAGREVVTVIGQRASIDAMYKSAGIEVVRYIE